jgi:hypothetical protein
MKRPRRPKGEQQKTVALLGAAGGFDVAEKSRKPSKHPRKLGELEVKDGGIAVIRPGKTRHGPQGHWRQFEFAQWAIQVIYGASPPQHLNRTQLARDVNDWLQKQAEFKSADLTEISRITVWRALKTVRP